VQAYMRKLFILLLVLGLFAGVIGCKSTSKAAATSTTGTSYATGFTLQSLGGGVEKLTDGEKQSFLLVPQGKKAPAGYENVRQITVPIKRAVILSVTFGALMRPLNALDCIVGSGTLENELYIDELNQRYDSGQIKYVGGGSMGAPDFEAIQFLKPDVVFISTGSPDAENYYNELKSMGLNTVVVNDYLETDPLGRLEWIKVFGAFTGKDKEADSYFTGVEKRVKDLEAKVATSSSSPNVLWTSIFMGTAYVSDGDSYVAKWVKMVGGKYLFDDLKGSGASSISLEELYARGKDADVFIYASTPPYINSVKEVIAAGPVLADIPVVKRGTIYCMQPWFYQVADKPDEILQDLAAIFHPELFPGYKLKDFMLLPAQ
jgi:iron complex transport system substrate-binding protein